MTIKTRDAPAAAPQRTQSRLFRATIWLDAVQLNNYVSATAVAVACALFSAQNRKSGICNPSLRQIGIRTRLSKSTICRALAELEKAGMIVRHQRHAGDDPERECLRTHYELTGIDDCPTEGQPCPAVGQHEEDKSSSTEGKKPACGSLENSGSDRSGDIEPDMAEIEALAETAAAENAGEEFDRQRRSADRELAENPIQPLNDASELKRRWGRDNFNGRSGFEIPKPVLATLIAAARCGWTPPPEVGAPGFGSGDTGMAQ